MAEIDTSSFKKIHKVDVKKKKEFKFTKKTISIIVILVVLIGLLCSAYYFVSSRDNYSTTVTNGSKTIISGDVTITKQGYFESMLTSSGAQKIVDDAYNDIANKLITNKKYKSEIDTLVNQKKETYASYSGSIESYATSMGYSSVSDFEKQYLIPEVKIELLKKKYFNDQYKQALKKYKVSYIKAITVSKESEALKLIELSKTTSFDELMQNDTYKDNANDYSLVSSKTSTSTLNKRIKNKLSDFNALTKDGVYKKVIKQSSNKYVVVYVYNTDKDKHKDTYVNALSDSTDFDSDIQVYYFKKYNFTVYDKKLKKAIEEINKNYTK